MEKFHMTRIKETLMSSFQVYNSYSWLLNCYVLDFFAENHWEKLPKNWQEMLLDVDLRHLAKLLNYDESSSYRTWPLSILTLQNIFINLSLPRKMVELNIDHLNLLNEDKLLKFFWKHIKSKKQHEISIMSKVCYKSAQKSNCFCIIDIGSGLGHLSRMLNYGYDFKVCAIEAQNSLSKQAEVLDEEFEYFLKAKKKITSSYNKIVHVNMKIESDITVPEFLQVIKNAFNLPSTANLKFGIVGLHPCGDLGATLLRLYSNCSNAEFINIVGCCYMKLSSSLESPNPGFPLSNFCINNNYNLSYHSKEIACHAIESYIEKLTTDECWKLKIHAYRALLETVIVHHRPDLHRSPVSNVKYTDNLTFDMYCKKALSKWKMDIPNNLSPDEIERKLAMWKRVVTFYSLRLLFAPLIETMILLDRLLYVKEMGSDGFILPLFNPKLSPRNHVLIANKEECTHK